MNEEKKKLFSEIERIAHEIAAGQGVEIVELVFRSQGRHSLLRIDIDRAGLPGVGLAECERMSRALGERIDALPFFDSPYDLQVSSPGIDRPIRTDDDLRRNAGRPVWLEFQDESGKLRELRGTLGATIGGGAVSILSERGNIAVARDRIHFMKQDVTLGRRR